MPKHVRNYLYVKQSSLILGNVLMKTFVLWKHARIMQRMIYMFCKMPKYAKTCKNMSIYCDKHAKTSQEWLICNMLESC